MIVKMHIPRAVLVFTKKTRITGKTTKYRKDHEILLLFFFLV